MYLNFKTSFSGILGIALAMFGANTRAEVQPDRLDWVQSDQQLCGGYYLAPDLPEGGEELEARSDTSLYDGEDRIFTHRQCRALEPANFTRSRRNQFISSVR